MYGIYFTKKGEPDPDAHRSATTYYEGRAFKMQHLPNYDGKPSDEVFTILLGSLAPQIVTLVAMEINGVKLEPGDKKRLKPPDDGGRDSIFRVKIGDYKFDIIVFPYKHVTD